MNDNVEKETLDWAKRWATQRGILPWDTQTEPFATCSDDFVPRNFHLFTQIPIIDYFLLPQREEGAGAENGKRELPTNS